ncbi:MAG: methyltransferase family protein [Syntrophobacteraceae bacterium]
MKDRNFSGRFKSIVARGGIIIFFIMAFEVMIMISPFAFFFYSVFNPILHCLEVYPVTRWLTTFFLPHMILPPTLLLKSIRILGSILFVLGSLTFTTCALQVYLGKIFKWGIADKGLYRIIRHPQYLALGLWGVGMAILWPRFLVLASLSLMFILYYFLAKDEERRMRGQFREGYKQYMERTGMFVPRSIERWLSSPFRFIRHDALRYASVIFAIPVVVIGCGFLLREITLHSLLFEARGNVTLVSIIPEDDVLSQKVVGEIFSPDCQKKLALLESDKDYLGYLMPADYIMQGMIANTGGAFHLHEQHNTFALISDWIFNPFEHLRRSPSAAMAKMRGVDPAFARRHHCPIGIDEPELSCESCPYRRIIFVEVDNHEQRGRLSKAGLLSFNNTRVPSCFVDINTRTGEIVNVKRVEKATAWRDVPTPAI